jgi:hypothetical protein
MLKEEKVQSEWNCGRKSRNILFEMHSTRKDASLHKPLPFMGEVFLQHSCLQHSCLAAKGGLICSQFWPQEQWYERDVCQTVDA